MRELSVVGVRVELPSNQPIVLLREVEGDRYLPIWIGAVEATAIAYEQQGVKPARPLTHDLLRDVLAALKTPLQAVEIMEMKENIFYAELILGDGPLDRAGRGRPFLPRTRGGCLPELEDDVEDRRAEGVDILDQAWIRDHRDMNHAFPAEAPHHDGCAGREWQDREDLLHGRPGQCHGTVWPWHV